LEFPEEANQPLRSLRGFDRIMVKSLGRTEFSFELNNDDVSVYDVVSQSWTIVDGG